MSHAVPLTNAFREDAVSGSLLPEEALSNAPEVEGSCIKVPKIVEG
jgi:aspartyl-tRNA(Asn)/glutamyl-tRNA(Gln) amidotransferase subunit C